MNRIIRILFSVSFFVALMGACSDRSRPDAEDPAPQKDTSAAPGDTTAAPKDTIATPVDTTCVPNDSTNAQKDTVVSPVDSTVTAAYDTVRLRIMDYNVGRFHKVLDPTQCAPMVASMIEEMDLDAVTLQELDSCRDGGRFQLRYLCSFLPSGQWNYFFGSNLTYGVGGSYGIGTMLRSNHEVVNKFHVRMPKYDGAEVRGFCVMESDNFVVISTHLDHKSVDARQQQMLYLNEKVKALYQNSGKLVFLAGDFNGNQSGGVVINARKAWTRVSSDDFTSTAKNPQNTIDHMFILNNGVKYKVLQACALQSFKNGGNVKQASDHLPIFIEFEFYVPLE